MSPRKEGPHEVTSGLRPPPGPPAGADPLEVTLYYFSYYERDFARARQVVKRRARNVVVGTALANGAIAVVGAAIGLGGAAWLGLLSTGLAGLVGVLAAWDGLFRHRELWIQRSLVLGQLQAAKRELELESAVGAGPRAELAADGMRQLNRILAEDLTTWAELRASRADDKSGANARPQPDAPPEPAN